MTRKSEPASVLPVALPPPTATIRYVTGNTPTDTEPIVGEDSIRLIHEVKRRIGVIRHDGGSILWVDYCIAGNMKRRYIDGRVVKIFGP